MKVSNHALYVEWTHQRRGITVPGRPEWGGASLQPATQNGAQFKTHILFVSFPFMFLDRGLLQVTEAPNTKPQVGEDCTLPYNSATSNWT